jgi:hypothetical protein
MTSMTATLDSWLSRGARWWEHFEMNYPFVRRTREFLDEHQNLLLLLVILKWVIGLLVVNYLVG